MFGFINIYKPKGKTSHDVVAILRRLTKIKQIGHTGTLDPFAEGVLPVCIGKATRLIEYLEDEKAYIGTVQLGESTTTYDTEGEIINRSDKKVKKEEIEDCLSHFRGKILQLPPIYSAIKVDGKKLYEYARKGEEVEIKPREVEIYKLEIVDFNEEKQTVDLYIECSKGTYIRSIAHDLGKILGCYGHLIKLIRTKAGKFELKKSIKLELLESKETVLNNLIYPLEYLNYPKYELNETEKQKVSNGIAINIEAPNGLCLLIWGKQLAAVAEINNQKAKICKMFLG